MPSPFFGMDPYFEGRGYPVERHDSESGTASGVELDGSYLSTIPTDTELANRLTDLGVYFVVGDANSAVKTSVSVHLLLCGLASSYEARMRLALIPLFLHYPSYSASVLAALTSLLPKQQQILFCYYTAAQLLQQKYSVVLTDLFGAFPALPSLFGEMLRLDTNLSADDRLRQLATQQAQLSGRKINWYGTYEHAYDRVVRYERKRQQWMSQ